MTRSSGQEPETYKSHRTMAMTTIIMAMMTTNVDDKASGSNGDEDDEVKRTCYASNIDSPTSQATSNNQT